MVLVAQQELEVVYTKDNMNEKIFAGKLLELKGRQLQVTQGNASLRVDIRADERRGRLLMGQTQHTTGYTTTGTRTPAPATPSRTTRSVSPTPSFAPPESTIPPVDPAAKAKAKVKNKPRAKSEPPLEESVQTLDSVEVVSDGSMEEVAPSQASGLP